MLNFNLFYNNLIKSLLIPKIYQFLKQFSKFLKLFLNTHCSLFKNLIAYYLNYYQFGQTSITSYLAFPDLDSPLI